MQNERGKTVAIFGGGVGGLSAAHELLERGFTVRIYERQTIPGGKARSFGYHPTHEEARFPRTKVMKAERETARERLVVDKDGEDPPDFTPGLPAEHGFRFFPGFYRHITDTMRRTPRLSGSGTVADDLVSTEEFGLARNDGHLIRFPLSLSMNLKKIRMLLQEVEKSNTGLTFDEVAHFSRRVWQVITSCEQRRVMEYERIGWWDFIQADDQSETFHRYFGNLTRSLVAAQPRKASTRTNGDILVQLVLDMIDPLTAPDRVLAGPTNEVWIHPWIQHLRSAYANRFEYYLDTSLEGFSCDPKSRTITSARIGRSHEDTPSRRIKSCDRYRAHVEDVDLNSEVVADYYISAIPVERMADFVDDDLIHCDHTLGWLKELEQSVEWMNGVVYFLKEDVPLAAGHVLYLDPPTALTSISQRQFWAQIEMQHYGKGDVGATLSVDVSDWEGLRDVDIREIPQIIWAQLKQTLNVDGEEILSDDNLLYAALDPSITEMLTEHKRLRDVHPDKAYTADSARQEMIENIRRLDNAEPLLVNSIDSWRLRPYADCRIENLFLASDYVRTHTDLATMEAANEAARRAVNAILHREGVTKIARIWALRRFPLTGLLHYRDRRRFDRGLPWKDPAPWLSKVFPPIWRAACYLLRVSAKPRSAAGATETARP